MTKRQVIKLTKIICAALPVIFLLLLITSLPALAAPEDEVINMQKTAQENIMFKEEQAAFFYILQQPERIYPGNALRLDFDASNSKNAYFTIKTKGLEIISDSITLHEYEEETKTNNVKVTYEQKLLTEKKDEYKIDLSKTHKYDASNGSLYFKFTGGNASLEIVLMENGNSLHNKAYTFAVDKGRGAFKLVKNNAPNNLPVHRAGTISLGIGLNSMQGSPGNKTKANMAELAKLNWNWSASVKTEGDIRLEQTGTINVTKDNASEFAGLTWFTKPVNIINENNTSGKIQLILNNAPPEFLKLESANSPAKVGFSYAYTPWKYELVNLHLTGELSNTEALPASDTTQAPVKTQAPVNSPVASGDMVNASQGSRIMSYVVIPAGSTALAAGIFFIFLFVYRSKSSTVKIFGQDSRTPEVDKLIKEMRVRIKSAKPLEINLTEAYDYSGFSLLKVVWNPKAFRGKHDIIIKYMYDDKIIHEDFFKNSSEAVAIRTIEIVGSGM